MLKTGYLTSPLGILSISVSQLGLQVVKFVDEVPGDYDHAPKKVQPYIKQLGEYFEGKRTKFDAIIDWNGIPNFQREVLKMVYTIPYGKTRTYKQIAVILGKAKATRAVGQANGKNPIAIVIPCHRVIGQRGDLTGYAYGIEAKMKLLELENPGSFKPQIEMFQETVSLT